VFQIDANAVHGEEVGTLLAHSLDPIAAQLDPPVVGDCVLAIDEEQNRCVAMVQEIDGNWVNLRLDWDLWMPGLEYEETYAARPTPLAQSVCDVGFIYRGPPTLGCDVKTYIESAKPA